MKNTSKILALVLIVMTVLMSLSAITASAATETVTKVFNPDELGAISAVTESKTAGTDGFFTLNMSNSKNESKSKEFEDGFKSTYRFSLNGNSKVENESVTRSIQFTTEGAATIKVWWELGNAGRTLDLYGSDLISISSVAPDATGLYISTFEVASAGTYYLAHMAGTVYFYKVEVSWEIETCSHTGGTATCKDLAVCELCGASYGELSTDHNFVDGACTVCEMPDPNACQHTEMAPATCLLPATCSCGYTEGEALGHDMVVDPAVAPTCTEKGLEEGSHCSRCDETVAQKEVDALGHTLTFVNTVPTVEAAGKTVADCSVCEEHFDFGEVNVMTPGTYTLDAADLAGIAQYSLFDGEVKVVGGVFACHLSYKYRTDANEKSFTALGWTSTHRLNFGGASEFCNNGEGEEAVKNGGLKNYIQIVVTEEATITFAWGIGDAGREIAIYNMEGELVAVTEENGAKNDLAVSTLKVPAGAYLIGTDNTNAAKAGGNYIFKMEVEVVAPHVCSFSDATCTELAKCECGATQGEALGHDFAEGVCTRCEEADPDYVPEQGGEDVEPPVDGGEDGGDNTEEPQGDFISTLIALLMKLIELIKKILGLA